MRKSLVLNFLVVVMLVTLPALVHAQDVTEGDLNLEHGQVNWTERTITATGSGAPDLKAPNVAVARLGAERVAKLDALRNILETLKGVHINSEITVDKEIVTNEKMRTKVEGLARNFKVLRTKYYSDGGVDIVVQMSLDGPIGSTLVPSGSKTGEVPSSGDAKYSGLIVDARGLKAMPALSPKLIAESGNVLFSSEFVETKWLETNGVVGYFQNMDSATKNKRVSPNPLILKATKVSTDSKTDLVLSDDDAKKIQGAENNLKFLTEGKVAIVLE